MIYQEKFELNNESAKFFSNEIDILITGLKDPNDERNNEVLKMLSGFKGTIISLAADERAQKFTYEIKDFTNSLIETKSNLFLIPDLRRLLKLRNFSEARVCVDITCLQQPIIFLLTQLFINEIKPKQFFAAYTEPRRYNRLDSKNLDDEEFALYEKIIGCNYYVPGFAKINRSSNEMLIAAAGFDKQRLMSVYENVEPKGGLIPILGFPSFIPGWNLTALYLNYEVIRDANAEQMIRFCEASSPFALYDLLKSLYDTYSDSYNILIAPLGTRPHCLGAAIFASKFKQCHLIYDFPVEKGFRSEAILKSNIYFLSNYIE